MKAIGHEQAQHQTTPTIIHDVIAQPPALSGSLPAFQSLATWQAWLTWLKSVLPLPMSATLSLIYRQSTGRAEPSQAHSPGNRGCYSIVGRRGGKSFISALTAVFVACFVSNGNI